MRRKAGGRAAPGGGCGPGRTRGPAAERAKPRPVAYRLRFLPTARREWDKLDDGLRETFGKLLKKRLETPRIGQPLKGRPNRYKIKLREVGYRLVYEVEDGELIVLVVAIGRRDAEVYERAAGR